MLKFSDIAVIFMVFSASAVSQTVSDSSESPPKADFATLERKDGTVLHECFISRVETDGLVLRHRDGVAHVSFFDLPTEVQQQYDFDPVAALKEYKERIAIDRERRKKMVLEAEKHKAAEVRALAERELYEIAKRDWMPAEATVVAKRETGFYARAKKVVLVPTKIISKLGFENDGPPKRKLERFGPSIIFLKESAPNVAVGGKWRGYIDPVSLETREFPPAGPGKVPVHKAVTLAD